MPLILNVMFDSIIIDRTYVYNITLLCQYLQLTLTQYLTIAGESHWTGLSYDGKIFSWDGPNGPMEPRLEVLEPSQCTSGQVFLQDTNIIFTRLCKTVHKINCMVVIWKPYLPSSDVKESRALWFLKDTQNQKENSQWI